MKDNTFSTGYGVVDALFKILMSSLCPHFPIRVFVNHSWGKMLDSWQILHTGQQEITLTFVTRFLLQSHIGFLHAAFFYIFE